MPSVPIVVLSANADVDDKVVLLELGADDYVTKPFSPKELLARVRRAMRRNVRRAAMPRHGCRRGILSRSASFLAMWKSTLPAWKRQRAGKPVSMTAQEFKLLRFLSRATDRVISREELLNEVWGYQNYPSTRTVDNHILRLRQKLGARSLASPLFCDGAQRGLQIRARQRCRGQKKLARLAERPMARWRLQTQLLLSTLLIICALTGASF